MNCGISLDGHCKPEGEFKSNLCTEKESKCVFTLQNKDSIRKLKPFFSRKIQRKLQEIQLKHISISDIAKNVNVVDIVQSLDRKELKDDSFITRHRGITEKDKEQKKSMLDDLKEFPNNIITQIKHTYIKYIQKLDFQYVADVLYSLLQYLKTEIRLSYSILHQIITSTETIYLKIMKRYKEIEKQDIQHNRYKINDKIISSMIAHKRYSVYIGKENVASLTKYINIIWTPDTDDDDEKMSQESESIQRAIEMYKCTCNGTFDNESQYCNCGNLSKCEYCGRIWDGLAQCSCD